MKRELNNKTVIVKDFPYKITIDNVSNIEEELNSLLEGLDIESLIFDFSTIDYISSVGLRMILHYKKKINDTKVINVSREVYEIFDIVGFNDIIEIKKKRRQISLENAKLIGSGFFSNVYRLDNETIVKVYIKDTSLLDIERELNLAKQAFILGVPTAISYDVVDVEGKLGVIFELLDCGSLRDQMLEHPENFNDLLSKYIALTKTINTTEIISDDIPNAKKIAFDKLASIEKRISSDDYDKIYGLLTTVPDAMTYVHGDCHVKNIMLSKAELLVIDMDTLSKGSPLFELSCFYFTYCIFEELYPGNVEEFLGIKKEQVSTIMNSLFRAYLTSKDENEYEKDVKKVKFLAYFHMCFWLNNYRVEEQESFEKIYKKMMEYAGELTELSVSHLLEIN